MRGRNTQINSKSKGKLWGKFRELKTEQDDHPYLGNAIGDRLSHSCKDLDFPWSLNSACRSSVIMTI